MKIQLNSLFSGIETGRVNLTELYINQWPEIFSNFSGSTPKYRQHFTMTFATVNANPMSKFINLNAISSYEKTN